VLELHPFGDLVTLETSDLADQNVIGMLQTLVFQEHYVLNAKLSNLKASFWYIGKLLCVEFDPDHSTACNWIGISPSGKGIAG
jgi:hypothetical protein